MPSMPSMVRGHGARSRRAALDRCLDVPRRVGLRATAATRCLVRLPCPSVLSVCLVRCRTLPHPFGEDFQYVFKAAASGRRCGGAAGCRQRSVSDESQSETAVVPATRCHGADGQDQITFGRLGGRGEVNV
jgi:hypothetical protein